MIPCRFRAAAFAACSLILSACAGAPTTPAAVHLDSGQGLLRAESALDAAVNAATQAIELGLTSPAQARQIADLTAPCPEGVALTSAVASAQCPVVGYLTLARQAYAASDTASWSALTANLTEVAARLATTHPSTTPN